MLLIEINKEVESENYLQILERTHSKVPFKRKAWGLRPKSHMILIEIKLDAHYLKKNSQTPQEKKTIRFCSVVLRIYQIDIQLGIFLI